MKKHVLLLLICQFLCLFSNAQNPQMVKDINTVAAGLTGIGQGQVIMGSFLYFVRNGYQLWKTDGTAAGTILVKHISAQINHAYIQNLTRLGTTLFFYVQ